LTSLVSNAQVVDTLSEFFTGTPNLYGVLAADGGGYVTGNNGYGDLAKGMRFNNQNGLVAGGSITNVLLWAPVKSNTTGTGSITVKVLAYSSATALGALLGSVTIPLSAVDTVAANYSYAAGRPFNVNATFASAITVPASHDVVIMVYLPTGAGDTLALVSNTSGDWANAATHTFEEWNDNTIHDFASAWGGGVNVALGIYPVVNFTASITENSISTSVYPNPAQNELNVSGVSLGSTINVYNNLGQVVLSTEATNELMTLNVSDFVSGIYTVKTINGTNVGVAKFVKK
jgi:hypothetical protein